MRDVNMKGILYCDFSSGSPSVSGLNGFNMLLPGSQTPHAVGPSPSGQLPSFGVPCMFLPSPGLAPFPVLYSPAIPAPISSAPATLPNTGPMNFGLPTLGSTAHLLLSPAAMVNPTTPTIPSSDSQLHCQPSLNLSPGMPGSHGVIHPESPSYIRHPVSVVKLEQVRPEAWSLHDGVYLHRISFLLSSLTDAEGLPQVLPDFQCELCYLLLPQSPGLQSKRCHALRQIFSVVILFAKGRRNVIGHSYN